VDPEGTDYRNLLPLKDNMLFYPAKIDPRKNQLAFAEMGKYEKRRESRGERIGGLTHVCKADADLLKEHNISLVFAGDIEDREYAEKV